MGCTMVSTRSSAGFTLIELLVALSVASLVVLAVSRLYLTSLQSYMLQTQLSDMHQNAHFSFRKIQEVVMQLGSELPDTASGMAMVEVNDSTDVVVVVNPNGGRHRFVTPLAATLDLPVEDAAGFYGADSLVRVMGSDSLQKVAIDVNYGDSGYTNGIDEATKRVRLVAALSCGAGDEVFSFNRCRFRFDVSQKILYWRVNQNEMVLAEDIEDVGIVLQDRNGAVTTQWSAMSIAAVHLTARTVRSDPRYTHPQMHDGFHRLRLEMRLRLRNKP